MEELPYVWNSRLYRAADATPIILNGLKRLEYRGYDSAGIAVIENGKIEVRREAGKLANLEELVGQQPVSGAPGIGHTRWATHGARARGMRIRTCEWRTGGGCP